MIVYKSEENDGLSEVLSTKACVTYATLAAPSEPFSTESAPELKAIASLEDQDLYYVQSILVTSSWNKNDDIFDKVEVWNAKNTPTHKPTNLEHDENIIVGHITANWPITQEGILINDNTSIDSLPNKFHILTGSVIYTGYSNPELKNRAEELINEIQNGEKYVSMECFFKGAYGGQGEHENYKIGRVLRDITFSGKGFVNKPANPESIIFNSDNLKFGKASISNREKNDSFKKIGVSSNQANTQENNIMSLEKQVAEIFEKIENISTNTNALVEANNTIAQLKNQLSAAETAVAASDENMQKMN